MCIERVEKRGSDGFSNFLRISDARSRLDCTLLTMMDDFGLCTSPLDLFPQGLTASAKMFSERRISDETVISDRRWKVSLLTTCFCDAARLLVSLLFVMRFRSVARLQFRSQSTLRSTYRHDRETTCVPRMLATQILLGSINSISIFQSGLT